MRFVATLAILPTMAFGVAVETLPRSEYAERHIELRTDEAKETSMLIKSLGGSCTTRFDVVRKRLLEDIEDEIGRKPNFF